MIRWFITSWRDGRVPVRVALLLDLSGWAIVLARPGDTFGGSTHNYDLMAYWMTETRWSVVFALAAMALVLCAASPLRFLRAASVGIVCLLETAVAVSFAAAPEISTGFLTYVGIALLSAWMVWRELVL